jgi:hypothetical protein
MATTSGERRLMFEMGRAFPADDDIAVWIASLSMALNDIRTAAEYAVRSEQQEHERMYFVRTLASHIREAVKIAILGHDQREDIQAFVSGMPQRGQRALDEVRQRFETPFQLRSSVSLFADIKRLRDDTYHYARDAASVERMREAMRRAATEQGSYLITDRALRAEYADVLRAYLAHPFDGTEEEQQDQAREMHKAIVELISPLSSFLHAAEAHWLGRRPPGIVRLSSS